MNDVLCQDKDMMIAFLKTIVRHCSFETSWWALFVRKTCRIDRKKGIFGHSDPADLDGRRQVALTVNVLFLCHLKANQRNAFIEDSIKYKV